MVLGGVPHYLKEAEPGLSTAQIVDRACFSSQGLLRDEFGKLYASLLQRRRATRLGSLGRWRENARV